MECCQAVGTYRPAFDPVIDTLASILEKRDAVQEEYEDSGQPLIVEHTNKGGGVNLEQNPAIRLVNDLNRDALAFWRDLGLTPAGLKRIDENGMKQKKQRKGFEELLGELGI